MNLAALAGWLELVARVLGRAGPVVARGPWRVDVFVAGMDSSLLHKAWDGRVWPPGTTGHESLVGTLV